MGNIHVSDKNISGVKKLSSLQSARERREFLNEVRPEDDHVDLRNIEKALVDDESSVHTENIIGATSVPLGVAGPLLLHGEQVSGEFFIPLATTEAALVASVNRGCRAIFDSGGVRVYTHRVGTTRGPVFYVGSIK